MKKSITLVFILLPLLSWSQKIDSLNFKFSPKITGLFKAKWEYCFDDHTNRFDIRNSRLGIGGELNNFIDYKLQVEYSNHNEIVFLDAYTILKPYKNLDFWFGQATVPFSEDYVIAASLNSFVNRTFVAKFVNPSSRDIGARIEYFFGEKLPVTIQAGVYNGAGINNPEWRESPFLLGRLIYGTMQGFRASVKYYGGKDESDKKIANYGFDLRYATDQFKIEAEYVIKDSINLDKHLEGVYLQGRYTFPIKNNKFFKYAEPTTRIDGMATDLFKNGVDISRLTIGINLGLDMKPMAAELRLNYETFFYNKSRESLEQIDYYSNFFKRSDKGFFDKFSIEFLIKF